MSYLDAFAQEAVDAINVAPEIDLLTSLLDGKVGEEISYQMKARYKPEYWSAVGLPEGWEINASTGLITGVTEVAGLYKAIITVSNFQKLVFTYSTNRVIIGSRALVTGEIVGVYTTGTLPSPLNASTLYEVYAPDTLIGGGANTDSVYLAPVGTSNYITLTGGTGSYYLVKRRIDEAALIIPILGDAISSVSDDSFTLLMDVDIDSGVVTFPTISVSDWSPAAAEQRTDGLKAPKLAVKRGDRFPVAIGFTRANQLQDLPLGSVLIGSKQYAPEPLVPLSDSSFTKIGSGKSTRYEVVLSIAEAAWLGILSDEEEDEGTYVNSICEVQYSTGGAATWATVSQLIVHDAQAINLSVAEPVSQAFEFDELPDNADEPIDFQLTLNLSATGNGVTTGTSITKPLTGSRNGGVWTFVDRDQDGLSDITTVTTGYSGSLTFTFSRYKFPALQPIDMSNGSTYGGVLDQKISYVAPGIPSYPTAIPGYESIRFYNASNTLLKTIQIGDADWAAKVIIPWANNGTTLTETKTITYLLGATTSTITLTSGMSLLDLWVEHIAIQTDQRVKFPECSFSGQNLVLKFGPRWGTRPSPFRATVNAVAYNATYAYNNMTNDEVFHESLREVIEKITNALYGSVWSSAARPKLVSAGIFTPSTISILTQTNLSAFAQSVAYLKDESDNVYVFNKTPFTTTVVTPFTPLNVSSDTILAGGWKANLRYSGIDSVSASEATVSSQVVASTLIGGYEPTYGEIVVSAQLTAPAKEEQTGYTKTSESFVLRVEDDHIEN